MNKFYNLLLIFSFVVLIFMSFFVYQNLKRLFDLENQQMEELKVINNLNSFLSEIKDVEIGQRGFLLTQKEAYLEPYYQALKNYPLYEVFIIENYPESYKTLSYLVEQRFEIIDKTLHLVRNGQLEKAMELIKTDRGKHIMDHIRDFIANLQKNKVQQIENQKFEMKLIAERIFKTILISSLLALVCGLFYTYLLYYHYKKSKRVAEELKQISNQQQAILKSAQQAIITTDLNGLITSFSRGAENMLKFTAEEMKGHSILDIYDSNSIRYLFNKSTGKIDFDMIANLQSHLDLNTIEWNLRTKDQRLVPCLQFFTVLRDGENKKVGYLFVGTDLSERVLWEEDLRKALNAADAANLAKSRFMTMISHELRTPLNSIIGFAHILAKNKDGHLKAEDLQYIKRVSENGKHLLDLINEIIDLSKIELGIIEAKKIDVDLNTFIENILTQLEGRVLEKNLKLTKHIPSDLKNLKTDPDKLNIILSNLIGNAIKYTPQGCISVVVHANENREPIRIDINDTGIGIDSEQIKNLFQPFYQVDSGFARQYGGSGLGLAIVHSISQTLGYQIQVQSYLGKGSTFSLLLNCSQAVQKSNEWVILMIDHSIDFLIELGKEFQDLGCVVIATTSLNEGWNIVTTQHIDLITLGLTMNELTIVEFIEKLKVNQCTKNIPFVFISSLAEEIRDAIPGALDYLNKKITINELKQLLDKLKERKKCF